LEVQQYGKSGESRNAFLEQLIIRKELADNFCLWNEQYDSFEGLQPWARNSLLLHAADPRDYLYSTAEFEQARTHDPLWNAAQMEMATSGRMHGYLRMYWAKKILEWSPDPATAFSTAIYLNDRYALDGHNPNGYAGVAWAIGGTHDRAWGERPVFGKIRYMNNAGCQRKFDTQPYIRKWI
jgi:deoxyribodipyrimidine photo-lyase